MVDPHILEIANGCGKTAVPNQTLAIIKYDVASVGLLYIKLEARTGIEPMYTVLQTAA